jgi:hypothetical protein
MLCIPFWAKSRCDTPSAWRVHDYSGRIWGARSFGLPIGTERDDSPDIERESALNDEYSVRKVEEMFQVLYEQMFFRLYEHERFHVNKVELSKQLLEGVARFYAPLMSQVIHINLERKAAH